MGCIYNMKVILLCEKVISQPIHCLANIRDIFCIFFGSKWLSWKDLSMSLQGNIFVGASELW